MSDAKGDTGLRFALAYARRGWPVLPAHWPRGRGCSCGRPDCPSPAKHPRYHPVDLPHGVRNASTDPAVIARWWRRWPQANVALATGAPAGFIVVDVDHRHGGDESLRELERRLGPLPETARAVTGSGGEHILLRYPGVPVRNRSGDDALAPGVDLKADGGYIIAPPSRHLSGRGYEWDPAAHPDDVPIAPIPEPWRPLLLDPGRGRLRRDGSPLHIPAGRRNDTLTRFGGLLRRYGLGEAAVAACLLAVNEHHAEPPLPEVEVLRIAASVMRYDPAPGPGPRRRNPTIVEVA